MVMGITAILICSPLSILSGAGERERHHDDDEENEDSDEEQTNESHETGAGNIDRIHGHILTAGNEPIEDAKILIEGHSGHRVSYSNKDGYYAITFLLASPEEKLIKVTKDGFQVHESTITIDGQTEINITLTSETPDGFSVPMIETSWFMVVALISIFAIFTVSRKKGGGLATVFLSPLYTKLKRDRILNHNVRKDIYDFLQQNPGTNYSKMRSELGLQTSSTVHHLRVLEREGLIRSHKELGRRLFYPKGSDNTPFQGYSSRPISPLQDRIIQHLMGHGPVSSRELEFALKLKRSSIHYSLKRLQDRELIVGNRVGRETLYTAVWQTEEAWD